MIRLAVFGDDGRMGTAVCRLAGEYQAEVVFRSSAYPRGDAAQYAAALRESGAQLAIDFSHASAFANVVAACTSVGAALVSGTTGFGDEGQTALNEAAKRIAVLWEPNMSVGIHVLGALVREAVRQLGASFDVEIVEAHHKHKLDAPSGTALRLAEAVRAARAELELRHGRHGAETKRAASELGMHAVRGGSVVGDHSVHLLGESERIELAHRAESRDVFARGALRAGVWLCGKSPGRYGLRDVLA